MTRRKIDEEYFQLARQRIREEYDAHAGKVVLVKACRGYRNDDSIDLTFDPPLIAVVESSASDEDLYRIVDVWMDPIWTVQPLETRPELEGCSSLWVYATSWPLNASAGPSSSHADFEPTGKAPPAPDFIDFTLVHGTK